METPAMLELEECPRCGGGMKPGTLRERGQYGGSSPYVWAPMDDAPFPLKGAPTTRRDITLYRCERCGSVEMYAPDSQS
jgi:uncharacterized C2H2 Zn-finger protein